MLNYCFCSLYYVLNSKWSIHLPGGIRTFWLDSRITAQIQLACWLQECWMFISPKTFDTNWQYMRPCVTTPDQDTSTSNIIWDQPPRHLHAHRPHQDLNEIPWPIVEPFIHKHHLVLQRDNSPFRICTQILESENIPACLRCSGSVWITAWSSQYLQHSH